MTRRQTFFLTGLAVAIAVAGPVVASKKHAPPVAARRLPVAVAKRVYEPGAGAAMHSHPTARFVYVISGGRMRVQSPEGQLLDLELVDGQGSFRSRESHALENIGSTTLQLVEFDLLQARPEEVTLDDSANLGPPEGVTPGTDLKVVFTNRWGCLIWHRVPPKAAWTPARPGYDTFVFRLTGAETMQIPSDGIERRRSEEAGFTYWAPAGGDLPGWTNVAHEPADLLELSLEKRSVLFRPTVITGAPSGAGS